MMSWSGVVSLDVVSGFMCQESSLRYSAVRFVPSAGSCLGVEFLGGKGDKQ